jgi:hypothetical protein
LEYSVKGGPEIPWRQNRTENNVEVMATERVNTKHFEAMRTLIALFLFSAVTLVAAQNVSLEDARNVIRTTKPILMPPGEISADMAKLFDKQAAAIEALSGSNQADDTTILIPYLSYPRSIQDANTNFIQPFKARGEDLNQLRSKWLVFDMILKQTNSATSLASYSLDKENPQEYRLAAISVLWYKDKSAFNKIYSVFSAGFINSPPAISGILIALKSGHFHFEGVPYIGP